MGRSKQPPVKRESSSEYFNKRTASWETSAEATEQVEKADKTDVKREVKAEAKPQATEPEAGVVQLVISVAGIYASL